MLACMQDQFTLLRELTVELVYCDDEIPLDVFKDAPVLQQVTINNHSSGGLTISLPWSQLLRYGGTNIRVSHLLDLRSANNLVDCYLDINGSDYPVPQTSILLPHLHRLSLSENDFLECLETPALLELYARCDFTVPVLSFLRGQSCRLQKLVLSGYSSGDVNTNLTDIVDVVPTVSTLALLFPLPANFVHHFSSRPSLTPALEYLSTALPSTPDVQDHFLRAIESRWQHGTLKSVKVHYPVFAPSMVEPVELLKSQSMEFGVFTKDYLGKDAIPSELRPSYIFF
ncbi:hypothetical protein B0H13DRAFT_1992218 [Mycena leptocephala]|nr:hypothetical protein B0H13DRAFT_1992218 [Mycena leptocephala]